MTELTNPALSGQALEYATEDFRLERAARHARIAADAETKKLALGDVLGVVDITGDLGRASSRRCPTCGELGGDPCVNVKTRAPIVTFHRERAGMRELDARATWHLRRENGQRRRFENIRACGGQVVATRCTCGHHGKARPQGCGVWRVCEFCSMRNAFKRRGKFARARGRVLLGALVKVPGRGALAGTSARWRKGGRYTDKMLTLTVPHFDGRDLFDKLLDIEAQGAPDDDEIATEIRKILAVGSNPIPARIQVIFAAWKSFVRRLRAHLKRRGVGDHLWTQYDRFFEWTPGADGGGHPHFHVWLFSPFLCASLVQELWTASLADLGVPMRLREVECSHGCPRPHRVGARTWLQQMGGFDERAVRELMAGKRAIELATFRSFDTGPTAATYAAGWAISDVMSDLPEADIAALYCALEGRRLSQGSARLYSDEPPPICPCCERAGTRMVAIWSADDEHRTTSWNASHTQERGPPS